MKQGKDIKRATSTCETLSNKARNTLYLTLADLQVSGFAYTLTFLFKQCVALHTFLSCCAKTILQLPGKKKAQEGRASQEMARKVRASKTDTYEGKKLLQFVI